MSDERKQAALLDLERVLNYTPSSEQDAHRRHERVLLICECIERWAPAQSTYRKKAQEHISDASSSFNPGVFESILFALRFDIEAGRLLDFEALVHADIFADFLAQAESLNTQGYRRAATVIAGGSLEEHLRQLARRNGITILSSAGKPREASALNSDLYASAKVYTKSVQAQIDAWQKTRNAAAHGENDFERDYTNADVRRMIEGIRNFIIKHPG